MSIDVKTRRGRVLEDYRFCVVRRDERSGEWLDLDSLERTPGQAKSRAVADDEKLAAVGWNCPIVRVAKLRIKEI